MSKSIFVLAIAGTSAAGKSTIVERLTEEIDGATILHFDDYEDEHTYPKDFASFAEKDFDPNMFKSEKFASDIAQLRSGHEITLPNSETILQPSRVLILEEPTGRTRDIMKPLIDSVIWLDVPLDVSIARRVIRTINQGANPDDKLKVLSGYAQWYLEIGREVYKQIAIKVKSQSDYEIDATQSVDVIVEDIQSWLQHNHNI